MTLLVKILKRAGIGFLLGVLVGNLIAALTGWPDAIVTDKLLTLAGGLSAAVLVQTLLSGVIGAVAFAGTLLYDIEHWPLLQIAAVHYLLIEAAYLPISFALGWLRTAKEALIWVLFSAVTYLIIFLILWAIYRAQVRKLDELQQKQQETNNDTGGQTK